jgi:hypothetical protein
MVAFLKDGRMKRKKIPNVSINVFVQVIAVIILVGGLSNQLFGSRKPEELFTHSDKCQACHNGLISPDGADISIGTHWRSSMMAHSAKDPYWQAAIRRETILRPSASVEIQDECSACHMPMMRYDAHMAGKKGKVFDRLPTFPAASQADRLAADGVSCSMCHQIQDENLGTPASFTAGFSVDTTTPRGKRPVYGPYQVDDGRQRIMSSVTDLVQTQSLHMQESGLCASCHTLYTHTRDKAGKIIGELPEQVPYLEWLHSSYSSNEQSCQSCHMPKVQGETAISSVLGQPRAPVSKHVFRGGNFFMQELLNRHRVDLNVKALNQDLAEASQRTREHLESSTARIEIEDIEEVDDQFHATVRIENLAGHKLPTAYPSRRAWICFKVLDQNGEAIFASGNLNSDGSIEGNDNDRNASLFEQHYSTIDDPEQVQIYEAIMADPKDAVTTVLLSAIRFIKDNRILPDGFDKASADDDIAVQGAAGSDTDFSGGGDTVRYIVERPDIAGPLIIKAELWYQPIAFRWARNLMQQPSEEARRFVAYYDDASKNSGIILAVDQRTIELD